MLFTIKDIRQRLDGIDTRYLKVEVDGELKGACLKSDMESWIRQYGNVNNRRRIKQVFLGGATHEVRIGINLYPLSTSDFWDFTLGKSLDKIEKSCGVLGILSSESCDGKRIEDVEYENIPKSKVSWDEKSIEDGEFKKLPKPKVSWDEKNGLVHFDDKPDFSAKTRSEKERPKTGLIARIKKWLKGDKGYKK